MRPPKILSKLWRVSNTTTFEWRQGACFNFSAYDAGGRTFVAKVTAILSIYVILYGLIGMLYFFHGGT